jgi:CDP-glucose 4,6-dehydratase
MGTISNSAWDQRSVLVTGAGGFVGSNLAAELVRRGAIVIALVRDGAGLRLLRTHGIEERVDVVHGDLTTPGLVLRALNEHDVDTVFHLAAQALVGVANRSPISTFESNIAGTWQLLEAARGCSTVRRVVVASSDKAYGQAELPYTESTPLSGVYPYDASKVCVDVLSRSYAITFGLPVTVARCANIYGPGDINWSRLIPGTIRSALLDESPIIRSDGKPERDYIEISDALRAYLLLAERTPELRGEAFNFGAGLPVSAHTVVDLVLSAAGKDRLSPRILGTASGEIDRQYLSSEKAERELGWRARHSLVEGLAIAIPWYAGYLKAHSAERGAVSA